MTREICDPRYVLIEVEGGYTVHRFDRDKHLTSYGWTPAGVTTFDDLSDVDHLKDQILN